MSKIRRRNTAYIEVSGNSRITDILGREALAVCGNPGYEAFGCHVFPGVLPEAAMHIINEDYEEYIITIDDPEIVLPLPNDANLFILGSVKPWHLNEQKFLLNGLSKNEYQLGCCMSYGLTEEEKRAFYKEFKKNITRVPHINDPFALDQDDVRYFNGLFGG